nr:glycosyltransferase family 2 protein [uncultured Acetatifactor sp.]
MDVATVIVTYNRKELVIECLKSIFNQSYNVEHIIIIDNASTDGTQEALKREGFLDNLKVDYHLMDENIGGAGGFYKGIEIAKAIGSDWIWIMDDDSIPETDCLSELVSKTMSHISFLASYVYGVNEEPMNVPEIDFSVSENGYRYWHERLDEGLVKIKSATFVSILINSNAVQKCGLPCKEYFIWGDDVEYTKRLTKYYGPAYFVGKSKVCHKRVSVGKLDVSTEKNPDRIKLFAYYYRNNLINAMMYESRAIVRHIIIHNFFKSFILLFKTSHGMLRFYAVMNGMLHALWEQKNFKIYIESQIEH